MMWPDLNRSGRLPGRRIPVSEVSPALSPHRPQPLTRSHQHHEYVLVSLSSPAHANKPTSADLSYTENPFASTHSLDTNPFDDPIAKSAASSTSKVNATRLEELEQRERDLERRETELNQRAEYIRKHGRNNWPPCTSFMSSYHAAHMFTAARVPHRNSLPSHLPFHSRGNSTRLSTTDHAAVPTMAGPGRHTAPEYGRLYRYPRVGRFGRRK